MPDKKYILGIDTSNYKTSIAITDAAGKVLDIRRFLEVQSGERGLRQSEALFQHVKNLPELFQSLGSEYTESLSAVAYSNRPRPVEGSYMPCFLAGQSFGKTLASFLGIPALEYSHQEGHIEAVRHHSEIPYDKEFIACHFSGGTCEILKVTQKDITADSAFALETIGGSKDISFGQVLDRAGVLMGFSFPCGAEMDSIALSTKESSSILTAIKVKDAWLNLSGIDTQIKNGIGKVRDEALILEIFDKIIDAIAIMLMQGAEKTGIQEILLSGGVSSSVYITYKLKNKLKDYNLHFDNTDLASDNAVGIAFLGGRFLWD